MGKKKQKKPKPTAQERALARVATKKFAVYERLYRPLAKDRLKEDGTSGNRKRRAVGLTNVDSRIANKGRIGKIAAAGLGRGLNIADDRVVSEQVQADTSAKAVRGHAAALARRSESTRGRRAKMSHVQLGHGLASTSQASMEDQAHAATSMAISKAQSSLQESEAFSTGLGQFAGGVMGSGGFDNMFGQAAPMKHNPHSA